MNISGNNRYELLSLDDEDSSRISAITDEARKQQTVVAGRKLHANLKNIENSVEKENKASAVNKNEIGRKEIASQSSKLKHVAAFDNKGHVNNIKEASDLGEISEERLNRHNVKIGVLKTAKGHLINGDKFHRQSKERNFYRGSPRNRLNENGTRSGKREFDRQSGSDKTGVKAIDKRDGAGAHNWGSMKQDIDDINKPTFIDKEESINEQSPESTAIIEEDTKEMTLDEWKALSKQRAKPQFNIRKAGEGEDITQWKKMIMLNKKKGIDSGEEFEYDPSMYPQRVGRLQRIVDIEFNFTDGRHGGGTRGNRSRLSKISGDNIRNENALRNGGGGGSNNLNKYRNFADSRRGVSNSFKVDDERQFPTLS